MEERNNKMRWNNDLMYAGKESIKEILTEICSHEQAKILLVLGKGFDPRMNNFLMLLVEMGLGDKVSCIAIDFPAGHSTDGDDLYRDNEADFVNITTTKNICVNPLSLDPEWTWQRKIKKFCSELCRMDISPYTDIIVDISSMPRSIYFNVVRVLNDLLSDEKNLFVAVSENVEIDARITKNKELQTDELAPLYGFEGEHNLEAHFDCKKVLIPILGEQQTHCLDRIYQSFNPEDVCPILPFPSDEPRRSDALLIEYQNFLDEKVHVKPQDIMYADEKNAFELYRILNKMIENYKRTLKPISDDVCFGIATFTSKLQSVGALLIGLENNKTAIFNTVTSTYEIKDEDKVKIKELNNKSVPYLLWIKGAPYYE